MSEAAIPAGMDNPYYPYSPIVRRPTLAWPGGSRIALIVLLHLEYWDLAAPAGAYVDPRFVGEYGSFDPDYRTWTQRDYGARVGIFRVLELLDRHGLKATVAANSAAVERYPYLVQALKGRGWEFAGHGRYANEMITGAMGEEAERALIAQSLDGLQAATGARPKGWVGQDYGESARTPRLLAEAGLDYVLDWPNDDQPYLMEGSLVSIPSQPEWDDVQQLWLRRLPMRLYPEMVGEAFDTLHGEGGRVFVLSLHPWLIGMAHRIAYLGQALERIAGFDGVWNASAAEVAAHFRQAAGR
ncbi:MAG: polysaccharide deacetylase family protein [Phenylobacterium sp.]